MKASERLARIKKYLEKMTPGRWHYNGFNAVFHLPADEFDNYVLSVPVVAGDTATKQGALDAHGIAALRTDAEWLIRYVEQLQGSLRQLVEARGLIEPVIMCHDYKSFCGCAGCQLKRMFERAEALLTGEME